VTKPTPLKEVASRINAHLKRFENDPEINATRYYEGRDGKRHGTRPYYSAGAYATGNGYVGISYITYQGNTKLRRAEAEAYLSALDGGFVGRHFEALREVTA
jgi:DNA-binding response OmpR family regulator